MTQASKMKETAPGNDTRMACMQAALEFQRNLARQDLVPDIDGLPHNRIRPVFEIIGAALLALGVAGVSLLGNFIIFNVLLHSSF